MPRVTIAESGKTPQPYSFDLDRKTIHIGRGSENDIVLECDSCSTHHATIKRVKDGYPLIDAGSTNGIRRENDLVDILELEDGMEVHIGKVPLLFNLSKEEQRIIKQERSTPHDTNDTNNLKEPHTINLHPHLTRLTLRKENLNRYSA